MTTTTVPPTAPEIVAGAWDALGTINDPCSIAFGCPLSLVEMGLVRSVEYRDAGVHVMLQLTEPTCTFTFRIADEIRSQLQLRLGRGTDVNVHLVPPEADDVWTEDRITGPARARLTAWRRQRDDRTVR